MARARNTTALISLDAAVIDIETTGLDPRTARIVELAAVRLVGGRLDGSLTVRHLVNPREPIPIAAMRIHGIGAAQVAGVPAFADVWPRFAAALGDEVLIGHAVGFDLAVIEQECRRVGIVWQPPPWLDTRLLAQVAEPALADHSLETLSTWLGVELSGRHSALGDAIVAAKIFHALVPKLRERGIRTLGEAMRASRALTAAIELQHHAGWREPAAETDIAAVTDRVDSYPYRHRVAAIMRAPAVTIRPDATLAEALAQITRHRISSLFVAAGEQPTKPADAGIVTERDILRSVNARGAGALDRPSGR